MNDAHYKPTPRTLEEAGIPQLYAIEDHHNRHQLLGHFLVGVIVGCAITVAVVMLGFHGG